MPDSPANHLAPLMDAIGGTNFTQLLLEEVGDSLLIIDSSHIICYCGNKIAELLGFHAEILLGKSIETLFSDHYYEFSTSGKLPESLLDNNGTKIDLSCHSRELRDSDGLLLGQLYCLTERNISPEITPIFNYAQLLEESNHRVRNNLAIICALLDMEMLQAPVNERHRLLITLARTRSLALVYNYASNSPEQLETAQIVQSTIENVRSINNFTDDIIPFYCPASLHICVKHATYLSLLLTEIFDFLINIKIHYHDNCDGSIIFSEENNEISVHLDFTCENKTTDYPLNLPPISRDIIIGMAENSLKGTVTFQEENGFQLDLRFPKLVNYNAG